MSDFEIKLNEFSNFMMMNIGINIEDGRYTLDGDKFKTSDPVMLQYWDTWSDGYDSGIESTK